MNTDMLRLARRLYNVDYVPRETNRANQRKWVRSVRLLGNRWLLAEYVSRKVIADAQTSSNP